MRKNTIFTFALLSFLIISTNISYAEISSNKNYGNDVLPDFSTLVENLLPTVVNISATGSIENSLKSRNFNLPPHFFEGMGPFAELFRDFHNNQRNNDEENPNMPSPQRSETSSLGSGFVIDAKNGYIITNRHVIENASEITVTFNDNRKIVAEIVGSDEKTDIAVIKLKEIPSISEINWGDSDKLPIGSWVLAIGNPFGLGGTVTKGIVSARNRDINAGPYDDFIQTDASINKGNSGGPLFNLNGEVVGINTAIFSTFGGGSIGIGFAIPANMAKNVAEQIIKYGSPKRGWLGVRIQHISDEIAESLNMKKTMGAMVTDVTKDGPAEKAGVKQGDIILEFDGQIVERMRSLPKMVASAEIGKELKIKVLRTGQEIELKVTIGNLEEDNKGDKTETTNNTTLDKEMGFNIDTLGIFGSKLTPELAKKYSLDENAKGVLITRLDPKGNASNRGLRIGDLIQAVNQTNISSYTDINEIINKAQKEKRNSVLLFIVRRGDKSFIAVPIKE